MYERRVVRGFYAHARCLFFLLSLQLLHQSIPHCDILFNFWALTPQTSPNSPEAPPHSHPNYAGRSLRLLPHSSSLLFIPFRCRHSSSRHRSPEEVDEARGPDPKASFESLHFFFFFFFVCLLIGLWADSYGSIFVFICCRKFCFRFRVFFFFFALIYI